VREISAYPGDPSKVELFYGESASLVTFLVDTYGQAKFAQLFASIKSGKTLDQALEASYGFDQDGLENAWRAAHDLPPRVTPEVTGAPQETGAPSASGGGGGTSTGTLAAIAIGVLALAVVVGFAGVTLARRLGR
jgi:hypothetical protein